RPMSIDLRIMAYRSAPLEPEELSRVNAIIERANAARRREWIALYAYPDDSPDFDVEELGRMQLYDLRDLESDPGFASTEPPQVLWGSLEMPLADAWPLVRPLLEHWCGAFSEIRRSIQAERWRASMDDFKLVWDEAA